MWVTSILGYNELAGSPREALNESSGSSAERRFLVPMSSRITFAQSLVGTAYPNFPQARLVAVDLQPWTEDLIPDGVIIDPALATADYGEQPCLVTARYGPDYTKKAWPTDFPKPGPIRFGTELRYQIKGSGKFLTVPTSGMKWDDDDSIPVPEDANSAILIPMRSIQIQWDFVDDPPISRLEGLLGKINDATFLGSDAETLLFENYDINETFRASPLVPHTNRVTIQMTSRRIDTGSGIVGWNHDYREEPAGWEKLTLSDGEARYKDDDFSGMFA